ncbi:hypothetical protein QFZ80_005156 [Paenibacillus sp. V4I7]|nr:hypothetical protein [Paenibacillus sp. V4I7]
MSAAQKPKPVLQFPLLYKDDYTNIIYLTSFNVRIMIVRAVSNSHIRLNRSYILEDWLKGL